MVILVWSTRTYYNNWKKSQWDQQQIVLWKLCAPARSKNQTLIQEVKKFSRTRLRRCFLGGIISFFHDFFQNLNPGNEENALKLLQIFL